MAMRIFTALAIIQLAHGIGWAQETFEVTSVKVAAPRVAGEPTAAVVRSGGPGTDSPERVSWRMTSLDRLIQQAYGVTRNQIVGPGWITNPDRDTRFDINATLAPGISQEQFAVMLQGLLKERFKFRSHREMRERPVYTLTKAKGGNKLKRSQGDGEAQSLGMRPLPGGGRLMMARGVTLIQLVRALEGLSFVEGAMVVDNTGLEGKFDIELPSIENYEQSLAGLISSIEKDLGLKVERGHAQVEVLVIDQVERVPTEN